MNPSMRFYATTILILGSFLLGIAQTTTPVVSAKLPEDETNPCATFADLTNKEEDEVIENYVNYRNFIRAEDYEQALAPWRKVYRIAPAADGHLNNVFTDGIFLYEKLYQQNKNPTYVDTVFLLYEKLDVCFPNGGEVSGRKAYDYYYKYPERVNKLEIYRLFNTNIDSAGVNTNTVFITPFAKLLVELYEARLLPDAKIKAQLLQIEKIVDHQLQHDDIYYINQLNTEQEVIKTRNYFEKIEGFFDCEYFVEKYYQLEDTASIDFNQLSYVLHKLKRGSCGPGNAIYDTLMIKYNSFFDCHYQPQNPIIGCLQEGDYDCALEKLTKAVIQESDTIRKSELLMLMANIAYVHQQNYRQGRSYAEQVAALRPNWGAPYIMIGRMYVTSDSLCTDGLDQQATIWAALDMWDKAKRVDPSSVSEAQSWIKQYAQHLSTRMDTFGRNLKNGDSYHLGCWIQRETTVKFKE